jgi:hypothetical protein
LQQESQSRGAAAAGNNFFCANITMMTRTFRHGIRLENDRACRANWRLSQDRWEVPKRYIRIVPQPR